MGRIYTFLLGLVTGFGLYHAAITYHVVQAGDGLHLVPKQPPRLEEVYVDVREFGFDDWRRHPQLVLAIEKSGKRHLLQEGAARALEDAIEGGLDKLLPEQGAGR